jgi:hypothetical protein
MQIVVDIEFGSANDGLRVDVRSFDCQSGRDCLLRSEVVQRPVFTGVNPVAKMKPGGVPHSSFFRGKGHDCSG